MVGDITTQARTDYQWAVQTYGAGVADKAAAKAGLAGADQAADVGTGHLSIKASSVAQLAAFFGDLQGSRGGTPPGEVSSGQSAQLENLLSASISGDTATFLARAMIKLYGEQRHENVLSRMQDGLSAQQQLMGAATQLDAQADKMQSAALTSLITTVVSSAITIGTSGASALGKTKAIGQEIKAMKSEMKASKELDNLSALQKEVKTADKAGAGTPGLGADLKRVEGDLNHEIMSAKAAFKQAEKSQVKYGLVGQVGEGVAKSISAGGDFNSKMTESENKHSEADVKRMEAEAQYFQTQGDLAKGRAEALDDMIKQILTFVRDQQDAKAERMQAFTRV